MEHSSPLQELRRSDEPLFGGKSTGLGELLAGDIPVPPGFALSTSAFRAFLDEAGLRAKIAGVLARVSPGDIRATEIASRAVSEAMRAAPMPAAVREEIARRYGELGDAVGMSAPPVKETVAVRSPPVAVRSSAVGEDSQAATFAGQQETYLWVREVEHVCEAVRDCWASLYSAPAISYRARLDRALEEPAMGVTVQLMVDAEVSGVMFTCNPVSGDPSMVAINASWGLGLAVVGGEVTPDDFLLSKITRELVREHIHDKPVEYVPDASGRGAVRVDVADDRRGRRCVDRAQLEALVEQARRIERHFGSHQDIEWAIARATSDLFIVQSRLVTAMRKREQKSEPSSAIAAVMSTFGANQFK